jgi:predicted dehydrogenase
MRTPLRVVLIGCGEIGKLRASALARAEGFCLTAVSDVDAVRARAFGKRFAVPFHTDWRVAIGDADLVLISTPPPLHAEMCVEAFHRGKHVLCEKPLARNPEEGLQILEAARQAGRHLATGFNYRFYPGIALARRILKSGRIGELDHIRSYGGHPGGSEFTHPWVHDVKVMGGGALVDNGIHIIDLTRHFLGEVAEVKGFRSSGVWKYEGCEDNGFALLRSPAGKIATLQASWTEWRGYQFRIEIYGTRGCVCASYPPMLVRAAWFDQPGDPVRRKTSLFPLFQIQERIRSFRWTAIQSFIEEFHALARAIEGEVSDGATGFDGLRALEIAHAVYESSGNGKTVLLP